MLPTFTFTAKCIHDLLSEYALVPNAYIYRNARMGILAFIFENLCMFKYVNFTL